MDDAATRKRKSTAAATATSTTGHLLFRMTEQERAWCVCRCVCVCGLEAHSTYKQIYIHIRAVLLPSEKKKRTFLKKLSFTHERVR